MKLPKQGDEKKISTFFKKMLNISEMEKKRPIFKSRNGVKPIKSLKINGKPAEFTEIPRSQTQVAQKRLSIRISEKQ